MGSKVLKDAAVLSMVVARELVDACHATSNGRAQGNGMQHGVIKEVQSNKLPDDCARA